ncbi:MAG TPA: hypothetical protein VH877_25825 [Polyangia bacterium]|jgi:hypothetical protein|nr:hypothetical protein [Polyangia bacterium]
MQPEDVAVELETLFEQLITQQRRRVADLARRLNARLTDDDLLSPADVPELAQSPEWNYEDGVLHGFLAAQMAVRQKLRR